MAKLTKKEEDAYNRGFHAGYGQGYLNGHEEATDKAIEIAKLMQTKMNKNTKSLKYFLHEDVEKFNTMASRYVDKVDMERLTNPKVKLK